MNFPTPFSLCKIYLRIISCLKCAWSSHRNSPTFFPWTYKGTPYKRTSYQIYLNDILSKKRNKSTLLVFFFDLSKNEMYLPSCKRKKYEIFVVNATADGDLFLICSLLLIQFRKTLKCNCFVGNIVQCLLWVGGREQPIWIHPWLKEPPKHSSLNRSYLLALPFHFA